VSGNSQSLDPPLPLLQWTKRNGKNGALELGGLRQRVAGLEGKLQELRQSFLQLQNSWEVASFALIPWSPSVPQLWS